MSAKWGKAEALGYTRDRREVLSAVKYNTPDQVYLNTLQPISVAAYRG